MVCLSFDVAAIIVSAQAWGFTPSALGGGRWAGAAAWALLFWAPSWLAFYQASSSLALAWLGVPALMLVWALAGALFAGRYALAELPFGWNDTLEALYGAAARGGYHSALWLAYWALYLGVLGLAVRLFSACGGAALSAGAERGLAVALAAAGALGLAWVLWRARAAAACGEHWHGAQLKYEAAVGVRIALTVLYGTLRDRAALSAGASAAVYLGALLAFYVALWQWVGRLGPDWRWRACFYDPAHGACEPAAPDEAARFWRAYMACDFAGAAAALALAAAL